jgi:Bacterial Ig-like domain (group 3)
MVNGSSSIVMVRNITAAFRYATTTEVAPSANPIMLGQSVTFTATVTPAFNAGAPTGTVSFFSKTNLLGSAPLSSNQASLAVTFTQPGSRTITAVYSGDTTYLGSTSPALDELVNKADSTTTLTSTPNPSLLSQSVTFTATVNSSLGLPPNGEIVAFQDGDTTIGTAALSVGTARFTTSSLSVGDHAMRAVYAGDARLKTSSGTETQTVNAGSKSR